MSTDADSESDVHGNGLTQPHDESGPSEQADTQPAVKPGLGAGRTDLSPDPDDDRLPASS